MTFISTTSSAKNDVTPTTSSSGQVLDDTTTKMTVLDDRIDDVDDDENDGSRRPHHNKYASELGGDEKGLQSKYVSGKSDHDVDDGGDEKVDNHTPATGKAFTTSTPTKLKSRNPSSVS